MFSYVIVFLRVLYAPYAWKLYALLKLFKFIGKRLTMMTRQVLAQVLLTLTGNKCVTRSLNKDIGVHLLKP